MIKSQSIQVRTTLLTLISVFVGIWVAVGIALSALRNNMEQALGKQQFASATILANTIQSAIQLRLDSLEQVSRQIDARMLAQPDALERQLTNFPVLVGLFNNGISVIDAHGTLIAGVGRAALSKGVNYMDRPAVATALREGKTSVGDPVLGRVNPVPMMIMVTPIRLADGAILGALIGGTSLGLPNFLDRILGNGNADLGTFQILALGNRQIVTASDKRQILSRLDDPHPKTVTYASGREGFGVETRQHEEQLVAGRRIAAAHWHLSLSTPTKIAFAVIAETQQRMLMAAILLTVVAGGASWWIMRRQLSPIFDTIDRITRMARHEQAVQALPVHRNDELGQFLEAVNVLLSVVAARETELQASEAFKQAVLNSVAASIVVLDASGNVIAANHPKSEPNHGCPWKRGHIPICGVATGSNYLAQWRDTHNPNCEQSHTVVEGLQAVINGKQPNFETQYCCTMGAQLSWSHISVTRLGSTAQEGVVIVHTDVTARVQAEKRQRESDLRLHKTLEAAQFGEWEMDFATRTSTRSKKHGEIFGQSEPLPNWSFQSFLDHVIPEDRAFAAASAQKCLQGEGDIDMEIRIRRADGPQRWVRAHGHLVRDPAGQPYKMCGIISDITDRKTMEDSLRVAAIAFETQEAMVVTDANANILQVNQAFCRITGFSREEAIGANPKILKSGMHDAAFYQRMWETLRTDGKWQGEIWDKRKDGLVYPKWLSISAVYDLAGTITHFVGMHFDISERKQSEAAVLALNQQLEHSRERLRALAAVNEQLLEAERKHIAREVHDELGQMLSAIRMEVSLLQIRHGSNDEVLQEAAQKTKALVDRAIQGVRNVVTNLRPTALDMGLMPALEWLIARFRQQFGIACALEAALHRPITMGEAHAVVVFRIVQESLTNVGRYAQATKVTITVNQMPAELCILIVDNGVGFDPTETRIKDSFGILGMQERALTLGGTVRVESTPGEGTTVRLCIPEHPRSLSEGSL